MDEVYVDPLEPTLKKKKVSNIEEIETLDKIVYKSSQNSLISDEDLGEINEGKEPHILHSFKYTTSFPNVTERYLTPYYYINDETPSEDTCIWVHTNRICMISLAPSHEIIKEQKKIKCINFKVSEKLNRAANKVSGKSKHGAQPLQPSSIICFIECENDKTYSVKCNMTGKLMEINDELLKKPELLFEQPHRGGYIAIALPNIVRFEALITELLNRDQYKARIAARKTDN